MASNRRLLIFRVIAICIAPVAILLIEAGLRIADYGYPTDIAVKQTTNGTSALHNNNKYVWRFFPPAIARTAYPFSFSDTKPGNTYRIFVLGGSAAAGTPDGAFSFGRILQRLLEHQYSQANFEVITLAMPAINSHVALDIARECTEYEPDLVLVYLGNNEVVGPYGAGTVFAPLSGSLSFIRFGIALQKTKLSQLFNNLVARVGADDEPQVWKGMSMFLENQVRASSPDLQEVYQHFRKNLTDIREAALEAQANIIFSTVATNLKDSAPFASLHSEQLDDSQKSKWDGFYQQGVAFEGDQNYAKALDAYISASMIDDEYADLHFRIARCYELLGVFEKSKKHYALARQLDALRFRADSTINGIIRDAAKGQESEGVLMVDADESFSQGSPNGIPGANLFYEHVHKNFSGNYLLAKIFFEEIEGILPDWISARKNRDTSLLTERECARLLAFFENEQLRLANLFYMKFQKEAPFANQIYNKERLDKQSQEIRRIAEIAKPGVMTSLDSKYRNAIENSPHDWWLHWKYGDYLEQSGRLQAAMEQFQTVLKIVPNHYLAYGRVAALYFKQNDTKKAIDLYENAIEIYPIYAEAHLNLGIFSHTAKQYNKAVDHYKETIRLGLYQAEAYNKLAIVLREQGKIEEAIEVLRNAITRIPNNFRLHFNLGMMLLEQKRRGAAAEAFRRALEINPNSEKTRKILKSLGPNDLK